MERIWKNTLKLIALLIAAAIAMFVFTVISLIFFPKLISRPLTPEEQAAMYKPIKESELLSRKNAHQLAAKLMKDNFYWNVLDQSTPFGSDDGWDACYKFRRWRKVNPDGNESEFLKQLLKSYRVDFDKWLAKGNDLNKSGFSFVKFYPTKVANRVILGCVFGQLYTEGKIDEKLIQYGLIAIDMELQKDSLKEWRFSDRRKNQLTKMKEVLVKVKDLQAVKNSNTKPLVEQGK